MAASLLTQTLKTKTNLTSTISRSFTAICYSASSSSSSRCFSSLTRLRPLVSLSEVSQFTSEIGRRCFSSRPATSSLNDPSPNWNNRPPKETILLDGCDFEHWLIVMEPPEGDPTRDEIISDYINTLASVLGGEEAARKSIYSVSTRHYFAFGCIVSEELSLQIKKIPRVRWVLPDSYLDVRNKDYGGEPFIDGQAVPYDPKYHEEWVKNSQRAKERIGRPDRPRNNNRRRETIQNRDFQQRPNPAPNMGGGMAPNPNMQNAGSDMGGMPPNRNMHPNMVGMPPNGNMRSNMGGMPPSGNMQPNNIGGMPSQQKYSQNNGPNMGGMPHNTYPQNNGPNMGGLSRNPYPNSGPNTGGMAHNSYAQNNGPIMGGVSHNTYTQNNGPNMGGMSPNANMWNMGGGMPNRDSGYSNSMPNSGGGPYSDIQNSGGVPYQGRVAPGGMPNRDVYQVRDIPGRDFTPDQNNSW